MIPGDFTVGCNRILIKTKQFFFKSFLVYIMELLTNNLITSFYLPKIGSPIYFINKLFFHLPTRKRKTKCKSLDVTRLFGIDIYMKPQGCPMPIAPKANYMI